MSIHRHCTDYSLLGNWGSRSHTWRPGSLILLSARQVRTSGLFFRPYSPQPPPWSQIQSPFAPLPSPGDESATGDQVADGTSIASQVDVPACSLYCRIALLQLSFTGSAPQRNACDQSCEAGTEVPAPASLSDKAVSRGCGDARPAFKPPASGVWPSARSHTVMGRDLSSNSKARVVPCVSHIWHA